MTKQTTRRDMLKESIALAGLGVLGLPEWAFPALAQDQTLVRFTDLPDEIVLERTPDRRIIDIRSIDGVFTPSDQFFTTQHYGHPDIDTGTYRLQVSGLVDRPLSLSLADLRAMPSRELVFGFECSGNRGPVNGLSSNGRWRGVRCGRSWSGPGCSPRPVRLSCLAPTMAKRRWSSGVARTPWTSSTAAASNETRRCRMSRC